MAEGDNFWVFLVEGNGVDDVAGAFCLFSQHQEGCYSGGAMEDSLEQQTHLPDIILELGKFCWERWGEW